MIIFFGINEFSNMTEILKKESIVRIFHFENKTKGTSVHENGKGIILLSGHGLVLFHKSRN